MAVSTSGLVSPWKSAHLYMQPDLHSIQESFLCISTEEFSGILQAALRTAAASGVTKNPLDIPAPCFHLPHKVDFLSLLL